MDDSDSKSSKADSFRASQRRFHIVFQLLLATLVFFLGLFVGRAKYHVMCPDCSALDAHGPGVTIPSTLHPPDLHPDLLATSTPSTACPPCKSKACPMVQTQALRASELTKTDSEADNLLRYRLSKAFGALETRGQIPEYLNILGLIGEGVEVGVRDGEFSKWILKHWKGKKMHMVDPWEHQDSKIYLDISNRDQAHQDSLHNDLKLFMAENYPTRHEIHRGYSVQISDQFADASLDFIYLDARHDYDGLSEDIIAWWPKLKVGGLFAGHDFVPDKIVKEGAFGVQNAVWEFANREKRTVLSISSKDKNGGRSEPQKYDGGWTTWYLIK